MSFWYHSFDQNTNENIVRISALKVFKASLAIPGSFLGLPVGFLINDITFKLGDKERFDKDQIGVKEPFPVTKC